MLSLAWAGPLSPDEAVALALSGHPDVAGAEAELAAASGEARQSAFLRANPVVEGGISVTGDRQEASIGQDISLTGEGLAAHRAAVARREAAEYALLRARLVAAAGVRRAWIEAAVASGAEELARQAFELAARLLAATEAKVRVGESSELDLRLARLEQATAARDLLDASATQVRALTDLATLIRRALEPGEVQGDPLLAVPAREASAADRSDVLAARAAAEAAKSRLSSARGGVVPALTVGAFAEDEDGDLQAGPSLGVTIPLWHQNQGATRAAVGELAAARVNVASTEARAAAEVALSTRLETTVDTIMSTLGPDVDADATQALQSVERGFAAGELDLPDTVFLRSEIVTGRTAFVEARGAQAAARIDALLAHDDPALLRGAQ